MSALTGRVQGAPPPNLELGELATGYHGLLRRGVGQGQGKRYEVVPFFNTFFYKLNNYIMFTSQWRCGIVT